MKNPNEPTGLLGFYLCLESISWSFKNNVRSREHREYANIKCCTKITPTFNAISLDKLEFV